MDIITVYTNILKQNSESALGKLHFVNVKKMCVDQTLKKKLRTLSRHIILNN